MPTGIYLGNKGKIPWNKGKIMSKEIRKKQSIAKRKNPVRYWLGKKRPSPSIETRKKLSEAFMGKKNHFFGKNHTEKTKKKIREILKIKFPEGRKFSEETLRKMRGISLKNGNRPPILKGEKHPNWQGGITPLIIKIRGCFKYRQWRSDVFTRDDFTCVLCNKKGGEINADHYPKSFSDIFKEYKFKAFEDAENCEEFWNINNGRTLCLNCHRKTYKRQISK